MQTKRFPVRRTAAETEQQEPGESGLLERAYVDWILGLEEDNELSVELLQAVLGDAYPRGATKVRILTPPDAPWRLLPVGVFSLAGEGRARLAVSRIGREDLLRREFVRTARGDSGEADLRLGPDGTGALFRLANALAKIGK